MKVSRIIKSARIFKIKHNNIKRSTNKQRKKEKIIEIQRD